MTKEQKFNGVKISMAAIGAILLAELLHLDFTISAGIVAILSVQPTKKETFRTASNRFQAFGVALLLAFISFSLVGYTNAGFFVYLFCFIFACQWRGWASAMAMNSVLISHFLTFGRMDGLGLYNEILLFLIGTSCGCLANLHLHEDKDFMEKMEEETDGQIKLILMRMADLLLGNASADEISPCFDKIRLSLRQAMDIAVFNFENKLRKKDTFDMDYIAMREKQSLILYQIYQKLSKMETTPVTAQSIADFLRELSASFHRDNTAEEMLEIFVFLRKGMAEAPLPVERKEFEDRAELYGVLGEIEAFMVTKKVFLQERRGEKTTAL